MDKSNGVEILNILKKNKIVIYGTGYVAMKFYEALIYRNLGTNIESFVISKRSKTSESIINGIIVKTIDEFDNKKNSIVCIAVHETIKDEIEQQLDNRNIKNYIWINRYRLIELLLGKPIIENIRMPVAKIVHGCQDYRIAIRYLAIENYFGKNNYGYDIYVKTQKLYCEERTAKKRLLSFCDLIVNCETNGYDSGSKILLSEKNELLDGMHRITLALYYHIGEVLCDIFKSSPYFLKWVGSGVMLTENKIVEMDFTYEELKIIEYTQKKIFGENKV